MPEAAAEFFWTKGLDGNFNPARREGAIDDAPIGSGSVRTSCRARSNAHTGSVAAHRVSFDFATDAHCDLEARPMTTAQIARLTQLKCRLTLYHSPDSAPTAC